MPRARNASATSSGVLPNSSSIGRLRSWDRWLVRKRTALQLPFRSGVGPAPASTPLPTGGTGRASLLSGRELEGAGRCNPGGPTSPSDGPRGPVGADALPLGDALLTRAKSLPRGIAE